MPTSYSYWTIIAKAWPIILANAAVPLLGLADTWVIGNTGDERQLGAIALGALLFNFVYWSFGFLRMSTTGMTAQAEGANDKQETRQILGRALLIAFAIGLALIILQSPIAFTAFGLFQASEGVESQADSYFDIRIWGAPASLATFAMLGTLIGMGKSWQLLVSQLFLNGLNITLDIFFASVLHLGVDGIAYGTVIAEWSTLFFVGFLVVRVLNQNRKPRESFWLAAAILDRRRMLNTLVINRDILLRTVILIFAFAWFTNEGARFGDATLAANHILIQLVTFSAFFLDGFAFVAESLVGAAIGARRLIDFDFAVRRSSILAMISAFALGTIIYFFGEGLIHSLTNLELIRQQASAFLYLACLYIILSVAAFQLDGIFIGAIRGEQMRNASIISIIVFLLSWWPLSSYYQNTGLWVSFIIYVIARAVALAYFYPAIRRSIVQPVAL